MLLSVRPFLGLLVTPRLDLSNLVSYTIIFRTKIYSAVFEDYLSLCSIKNIHIIQSDLFIVPEYDLIGEYENYFSKMVNEYREKPPSMEEKGVWYLKEYTRLIGT